MNEKKWKQQQQQTNKQRKQTKKEMFWKVTDLWCSGKNQIEFMELSKQQLYLRTAISGHSHKIDAIQIQMVIKTNIAQRWRSNNKQCGNIIQKFIETF